MDYCYQNILLELSQVQSIFQWEIELLVGLSNGVLVIEAKKKSGSLITVDFALEQGRNVYVLPGSIYSPQSVGTNDLIKEGAKVVTRIDDILEDLWLCEIFCQFIYIYRKLIYN